MSFTSFDLSITCLFVAVLSLFVYGFSAEIVATDRHFVQYNSGVVYDMESGLE
jgi:hypothetical protein